MMVRFDEKPILLVFENGSVQAVLARWSWTNVELEHEMRQRLRIDVITADRRGVLQILRTGQVKD